MGAIFETSDHIYFLAFLKSNPILSIDRIIFDYCYFQWIAENWVYIYGQPKSWLILLLIGISCLLMIVECFNFCRSIGEMQNLRGGKVKNDFNKSAGNKRRL